MINPSVPSANVPAKGTWPLFRSELTINFPNFFPDGPLVYPPDVGRRVGQDFKVTIDIPIISKMFLKRTFERQQKITPPWTDRVTFGDYPATSTRGGAASTSKNSWLQ
jgi:hypothetical protein